MVSDRGQKLTFSKPTFFDDGEAESEEPQSGALVVPDGDGAVTNDGDGARGSSVEPASPDKSMARRGGLR